MTAQLSPPRFATLLQDFFAERLLSQRQASPRTVASYRDTFRLLLRYVQVHRGTTPSNVSLTDLDAPLILRFLDHLEKDRKNSARSRNLRLAAVRSFMHYVATQEPTQLPLTQRVLAIPVKRLDRPLLGFLSREEINALLAAPDPATWSGHRDRVMWLTFYNTGMRVSELIGLHVRDLELGRGAPAVTVTGKGRKQRVVPLWKNTVVAIKAWLARLSAAADTPVFPSRAGQPLSRSGVAQRLLLSAQLAARTCPSLTTRPLSPHILRHTTAMHLLQSGVDITVIALWLGHEQPTTTHHYVEADLAMKERALRHLREPEGRARRFRAPDSLLAFLGRL